MSLLWFNSAFNHFYGIFDDLKQPSLLKFVNVNTLRLFIIIVFCKIKSKFLTKLMQAYYRFCVLLSCNLFFCDFSILYSPRNFCNNCYIFNFFMFFCKYNPHIVYLTIFFKFPSGRRVFSTAPPMRHGPRS